MKNVYKSSDPYFGLPGIIERRIYGKSVEYTIIPDHIKAKDKIKFVGHNRFQSKGIFFMFSINFYYLIKAGVLHGVFISKSESII